jgi:hypothetical protein
VTDDEIEAVASAFYLAEYDSASWCHAPEPVKEQFRLDAKAAIAEIMEGEPGSENNLIFFEYADAGEPYSGYLH